MMEDLAIGILIVFVVSIVATYYMEEKRDDS